MSLVHRLRQCIGNAGAHPDHRRLLDAQLHGDCVGSLEANAANVPRQAVGVFRHDLNSVGAVGLIDSHGASRADTMAVQEDHDLPHDLLLGPRIRDSAGADRANARDFPQARRFGLDRVEDLFAEGADQLLRVDRTDAPDHAGAKIFFDAIDRGRRRGLQELRPELLPVGAVVDPVARRGDPFAGGNHGGVADCGDKVSVTACFYSQDAEAVLGVVIGDALNEARQYLLGR